MDGGGGGEEEGPRAGFEERSRIRGIGVFICKPYCFLVVFYTTCVGAHGGSFSGIINARDKQGRGGPRAHGQREAKGEEEERVMWARSMAN